MLLPRPASRCFNWILIAGIAAAMISTIPVTADDTSATTEKSPSAAPSDTAPIEFPTHISPLATQGPKPEPITPPKPEELTAAIERGVKFLLQDQRSDGSWGSAENTKSMNIYAPAPGAHLSLIHIYPKLYRVAK